MKLGGIVPILILAAVVAGLLVFGFISLTTNLWTAVSLTVAAFGLVALVTQRKKGTGYILLGAGLAFYLFANGIEALPSLSVGEALSMGGVSP